MNDLCVRNFKEQRDLYINISCPMKKHRCQLWENQTRLSELRRIRQTGKTDIRLEWMLYVDTEVS